MNNNRQYLGVGLFVIITATILISVWLWFGSNNRRAYNIYATVFNEPVDGLSIDSVVKYNGVDVGRVREIKLDSNNPRNIYVDLNILQNVPVNVDTVATLKSQGMTGLAYIALKLPKSSTSTENLVVHNDPPYPNIPTQPSLLYGLSEQAQSLATNMQDISSQMRILLDVQNVEHFSNVLANLDKTSTAIASRSDKIEQSIDTLSEILKSVKDNSQNLNATFKDLSRLSNTLSTASQNANNLILNVQNNTLQDVNAVLLPNLNQTISHLNQSSYQLEEFLKLLNQNPSALVRGRIPTKPGPGE